MNKQNNEFGLYDLHFIILNNETQMTNKLLFGHFASSLAAKLMTMAINNIMTFKYILSVLNLQWEERLFIESIFGLSMVYMQNLLQEYTIYEYRVL